MPLSRSSKLSRRHLFLTSAAAGLWLLSPAIGTPTSAQTRSAPPRPSASVRPAAWADAPLSAGAWAYRRAQGSSGSRSLFGPPGAPISFQVACEAGRQISLFRPGAAQGSITIRTSSTARTLPGTSRAGQGLSAQLPAGDPLLDAIAFSRGRFAVEAPGVPALVIPAWPELARVVEDCRR